MKEISFDVELTRKELYEFSMRHTYCSASGVCGLIISFGSLAICAVKFRSLDMTAIAALIIIGLLFTVIQPVMLFSKAGKQVKKNKNINTALHYTMSDDGITVAQGEQEAFVKWYEIRKKVVTKNSLYVYMSPVRAFIFPKSQCLEDYDDIVSMVTAKMEKYKDYEPEDDVDTADNDYEEKSDE